MQGNLTNLNKLIPGTVIKTCGGEIGVVRFMLGTPVSDERGDICEARPCITFACRESYVTFRRDGISNYKDECDIAEIIYECDGSEIDISREKAMHILMIHGGDL